MAKVDSRNAHSEPEGTASARSRPSVPPDIFADIEAHVPAALSDVDVDDRLREFLQLGKEERRAKLLADPAYARVIFECCLRTAAMSLPQELFDAVLEPIRARITSAHALLELPDSSSDAGTGPVARLAWQRAGDFLIRAAEWLWRREGRGLRPPDITPGVDGSIDLHWDRPAYEMLINIPAEGMAGFYGDDRGRISIKGRFDPAEFNEGLLLWLTKAT